MKGSSFMKKGGKLWRKSQKEKEIRKTSMKIGKPFSRARQKKHLCLHYDGVPGGLIMGNCVSKLRPINEKECMCCECHKIFPIEKYEQMEKLVDYLTNKCCITDIDLIAKLSEGLDPVYYRRLSEDEIEILEER